ncbi:MAG: right-handed parallel beta-helix repeat-containing protein [Pseudomonadota bacterium]
MTNTNNSLLFACLLFCQTAAFASVDVVPGLVGFGTKTPAGRGGQIIRVINLLDSGPGSLRHAVETEGPRTVIFEVGGSIQLQSDLKVRYPFITIAGQTAPSPGVTLRGAGIKISTHDVLLQHLRVRVGDLPNGPSFDSRDGIGLRGERSGFEGAANVVIDHCSISWATDEGIDTWFPGVRDVTISASIISENLSDSRHSKGEHSAGMLIGDGSRNIAVSGNLFAHNMRRNPLVKGDVTAVIVRNLIYNPGKSAIELTDPENSGDSFVTISGNVMIPGRNTEHNMQLVRLSPTVAEGSRIFSAGNRYSHSQPDGLGVDHVGAKHHTDIPPIWIEGYPLPSHTKPDSILRNVGARPRDRDAVDKRVVLEVLTHRGRVINSQQVVELGDQPPSARHVLSLPKDPNGDNDGNGYTNLEEWLHTMAENLMVQ